MFYDFFSYWDDLPADGGMTPFGMEHMIWLLIITVVIIAGSIIYKRKALLSRKRILHAFAFLMTGMEICKYSIMVITGNMGVQYLPLQLCGMAVIIEIVYVFFPSTFLGEVICTACLPGAAAALIFPDWSRYPVFNYMSMHGFIMHGLLILFPCMLMAARDFVPRLKNVYMVILFFVVAVPLLKIVNHYLDTNFMFLERPSRGSPFQPVYNNHGYTGYMVVYGIVVLVIILAMYGIAYFLAGKYRKQTI